MNNFKNKNVLIFFYAYPAYKVGGPVHSIESITELLGEEIDFTIVSPNKDLDGSLLNADEITRSTKNSSFHYISFFNLNWFFKFFKDNRFDYVYINSFFSITYFSLMFLSRIFLSNKIILAPRGQFSNGAMSKNNFIKKTYILIFKIFTRKIVYKFHATNTNEKNEIINALNVDPNKITVARNLRFLKPVKNFFISKKKINKLKLVFYSRIVPKKNLLLIIEYLLKINNPNVCLDIYGTYEDYEYFIKCKNLIKSSNSDTLFSFKGSLTPNEVLDVLSNYDFFILPTKNENFGHVIVESLYASCPVILSPNTPFSDMVESRNIGYIFQLDNFSEFDLLINDLLKINKYTHKQLIKNIYNYLQQFEIENKKLLKNYQKLFN
tara:strand:+ start:2888 stop:4027 length:1140 start_codon:yes stop_codon:yes gene_type:complete